MKIYAVIDRKAKSIVNIFASVSDESAERSFLMLLTGERSIFTDFPEDFDLYPVADLSIDGGLVVCAQGMEHLKDNGFTINSYRVTDAIKNGSDYDKRYLLMVHNDRFAAIDNPDTNSSEV